MCLLLTRGFCLATLSQSPDRWSVEWWLSFWKFLPSPHRISGAHPEWPSGSWSSLLPRPFSPDLAGRPALGRVLVVRNLFHLRILPRHNPVSMLCRQSLQTHGLVVALICIVSCETLYRQVCDFPNHVQLISSVIAKGLNTEVNVIFQFFLFNVIYHTFQLLQSWYCIGGNQQIFEWGNFLMTQGAIVLASNFSTR